MNANSSSYLSKSRRLFMIDNLITAMHLTSCFKVMLILHLLNIGTRRVFHEPLSKSK